MKKLISKITSHSLFTSSMIVFVGSMASNVAAYLYHLLVGRILGPVGYGELAALISFMYILNVPAGVINTGLIKYFSTLRARGNDAASHFVFDRMNTYMLMAAAIGAVVVIPFVPMLGSYLQLSDMWNGYRLYFIFVGYLLTIPTLSVLGGYQKFTELTVVNIVIAVFRLGFGLVAASFGVAWTLTANIFSSVGGALIGYFPAKKAMTSAKIAYAIPWKRALSYGGPLTIATIAATSLISTDVLLVKHYFDPHTAGIYSAISVLGKVIFYASYAINAVLFPMISERHAKDQSYRGLVLAATGVIALLSSGMTAVYFLMPTFVVHLLFGAAFDEAIPFVGLMGIFFSFAALVTMFNQILLAAGQTDAVWYVAVAALFQIGYISIRHATLYDVMTADIIATGVCALILGYLAYTRSRGKIARTV
jgi:O-antigen/teichoic acid export membrane protein